MNFVRIGNRVINLANVTEMWHRSPGASARVVISFIGNDDNYITVSRDDYPEEYRALVTWMDEQPMLLRDEE